jgi:cytochrome P450
MAVPSGARLRFGLLMFRSILRGYALLGDASAAILARNPDREPYPLYERVRAQGEVSRSRLKMYATASHSVINSVLRDQRFGVRTTDDLTRETFQNLGYGEAVHPIQESFLSLDPPTHTRLRKMVSPWFSPKALRLRGDRIEEVVNGFLDELGDREEFDLIDDFAVRVPVQVICDLLGVPGEEYPRFIPWGAILGASLDDVRTIGEFRRLRGALVEMADYFTTLIEHRRAEPGDDLISELVAAGDTDPDVLHKDLLASTELLLVAGFETTVNLIGNGVLALLRNPDVLAWFTANPDRADDLVEEVLRHDPPVQFTMRLAHEPLDLAGAHFGRDDPILLLLAGANRDPAVFSSPGTFDPTRANNRDHLAFSAGVHYCLGAGLARIEAAIALRALFTRYPNLALAGRPRRRHSRNINGMLHLPVRGTAVRRSAIVNR